MTHDYERHGTTTLFAALNVLNHGLHSGLAAALPKTGVHSTAGGKVETCA